MMRPPSLPRADKTIDGLEYASDVTHVQWNVYMIRKMVITRITPDAT